ncbi:MAG: trypsin-like peptidase domain-containing protein [Planctomycetes bacterium]|nr:trypsin-like peptidase domain-containing protein [Planctomycetota bacterium]
MQRWNCSRTWRVLALLTLGAWTSLPVHGQAPSKKVTGELYENSPVDAIAARIRTELKSLSPIQPEAPTKPTPEKPTKAPPAVARPVTSSKVKVLEANALKCQSAEEALTLYKFFMSDPGTTADEKEQAQTRFEYWEQAAVDQLVRVGTKWMTRDEAEALRKEADKLVEEALEMLNIDNFAVAQAKLEKAGKVYPDHLESLFLLAVGSFLGRDFKLAETRFAACLNRAPNNVALLSNMAVSEVHNKHFAAAVKHWEKAGSVDPDNKNVAQNVGTFVSDVGQKRFANVDKRIVNDATELYSRMLGRDGKNRANPAKGYVLMRIMRTKPDEQPTEESQVVGNGTGFVIADGIVITNRHVVEDADSLVIQDPSQRDGLPLAAKVIASSKDLDVALIECKQLKVPPVPLSLTPVTRSMEVMALGYPIATVVGKGLKSTRGIVTGLPSTETENMLVLDVQVNPGNSGGPLCDRSGRVVGIVAAKTYTTTFIQGYGLAIPMNDAMPFIKLHLKGFSPTTAEDKPVEWTEVDSRISPSTVMILIQKKR